jgi:hypothetical protein
LPRQRLADQFQRQIGLALILQMGGQLHLGGPRGILQPFLGKIEPPTQRTTGLRPAPVQTHRHLVKIATSLSSAALNYGLMLAIKTDVAAFAEGAAWSCRLDLPEPEPASSDHAATLCCSASFRSP